MSGPPESNATFPADHGLATLGLLMQLSGSVTAVMTVLVVTVVPWGFSSAIIVALFFVALLSGIRSLLHRAAGVALAEGRPRSEAYRRPINAVRTYVAVGIGHSVVVGLVFHLVIEASLRFSYGLAAGLAVWPVILWIAFSRSRLASFEARIPAAEDRGFEGLGVTMVVFGACGVLACLMLIALALKSADVLLQDGPGVLVLIGVSALVVRSVMHVQAGLGALEETDFARTTERAHRYATTGVLASFGAVGTLFVASLVIQAIEMRMILGFGVVLGMLLAWPYIVRGFVSKREIDAAESREPFHRAPDAGQTTLGWLLLALAGFHATLLVPNLISNVPVALPLFSTRGMQGLGAWQLVILALQMWTAIELLTGGPARRWVATAYGAIAVGLMAWKTPPLLSQLDDSILELSGDALVSLIPLTLSFVVPLATIYFVRRSTAVNAQARVREPSYP